MFNPSSTEPQLWNMRNFCNMRGCFCKLLHSIGDAKGAWVPVAGGFSGLRFLSNHIAVSYSSNCARGVAKFASLTRRPRHPSRHQSNHTAKFPAIQPTIRLTSGQAANVSAAYSQFIPVIILIKSHRSPWMSAMDCVSDMLSFVSQNLKMFIPHQVR